MLSSTAFPHSIAASKNLKISQREGTLIFLQGQLTRPGIEGDDQKFLDHINAKIMKEADGSQNPANPKALNALLAEDTFQRLIGTFEFFLRHTAVRCSHTASSSFPLQSYI